MVTEAGQPEILRASQRDAVIQKKLSDELSQIFSSFLGIHKWLRWRNVIEPFGSVLYQTCLTLGNFQTLGEEYTGILLWSAQNKLPTKQMQVLMILQNCLGERLLLQLLTKVESKLNDSKEYTSLRPEARETILIWCTRIRSFLPFIIRLHQAIFFFQGKYYLLSKRTTGVRYVLIRYWLRDQTFQPTFRLLGVVSFLHLIATFLASIRKSTVPASEDPPHTNFVSTSDRCSLCLSPRKDDSCTPCGHLFCWDCIVPWVLEQQNCPICKQPVQPSRVVLLHNFKKPV